MSFKTDDNKQEELSLSLPYTELNKQLNLFLEASKNYDLRKVNKIVSNIEILVIKIYISTDKDWENIKKILNDLRYYNRHFTNDRWRFEKIQELYKDLCVALNKDRYEGPLKNVFETFYNNIDETLQDCLMNSNIDAINELKNLVKHFRSLDVRLYNERPELYNKYRITLEELSRCLPLLATLQPIERENKIIFHKDAVKVISTNFSKAFQVYANFLTSFENPNSKKLEND